MCIKDASFSYFVCNSLTENNFCGLEALTRPVSGTTVSLPETSARTPQCLLCTVAQGEEWQFSPLPEGHGLWPSAERERDAEKEKAISPTGGNVRAGQLPFHTL